MYLYIYSVFIYQFDTYQYSLQSKYGRGFSLRYLVIVKTIEMFYQILIEPCQWLRTAVTNEFKYCSMTEIIRSIRYFYYYLDIADKTC